jgi:WD40 repeat protein/serine/threonine protein kinase
VQTHGGKPPEQPVIPRESDDLIERTGISIGRYKLLQQIGEGGFGIVYMAEQTEPVQRKVALKIIKAGMDTREIIARFEAERQALALMDHPNIAQVHDGGATETGRPYFVMELVRGVPITAYCDQANLTTRKRLELFIKVCRAVQHAHQKGVIHRDLKPGNVLVTLHDGEAVPKVIDFGVAKALGQKLTDKTLFTRFEQMVGTPAYMSPEQASLGGLDIDTRSDIYSLGVLLYELLTGVTPLDDETLRQRALDEIRRMIRETDPPRPSMRLSTLGERLVQVAKHRQAEPTALSRLLRGDLDWIVLKALEKDRRRRYETANGLAADIQRFLENEPVTAVAPSASYRLRKFVRRNRTIVKLAAAIVALLLGGITASTWLAILATRARTDEAKANYQLKRQVSATEEALQRMQIQKAEELLANGQAPVGIAYLGQVLRANPSNQVASARLVSALVHRCFALPLTEPLRHEDDVRSAEFSPDGRHVLTVSSGTVQGNLLLAHGTARVWDTGTGQPLTEPLRHEGWVSSAQFSPDGLRILTASTTARVWDTRTGQPVTELRHDGKVRSARFSPDGQRVVTSSSWNARFSPDSNGVMTTSSDNTARVWDARTGQPVTEPLRHEGDVSSAEFSPDGLRIVTASSDKTARVWDARSGRPLTQLRHDSQVRSARFSPDGQRVVTTSSDNTARVWDARTGQSVTDPLRHEGDVSSAEFSPDGLRVVTASWDRTARLWDARTGQALIEPLRHEGLVYSAQFSPDSLRILTASSDKTARVWYARTGQPLTEPLRHDGQVRSARFSPDGQRVVTACSDGMARVWDVRPGQLLTEQLRRGGDVSSAQFSPGGHWVVTASKDGTARVWDARTGQPLIELGHDGQVRSARFSPDGQRVVTTCPDGTARVWDARTGKPLTEPLRVGKVLSAQLSPDGQRVLTVSQENAAARVWNARTGQPLTEPLRHEYSVSSAQFSPDGKWVLTASNDKTARVWDALTGQPLTGPLRHEGAVSSAQFSPDGQRVVTASTDKTTRIWDARTGQPVTEPLRHEDFVNSARFSRDSLRIVTASSDKTARVWDARTGQALTEPLRHGGVLFSAEFSPDGLQVVTASYDRTARVWDARTGQPLTEPLRHEDAVLFAEFSPDGQQIVTVSGNTARVWDVPVAGTPVPGWFIGWAEAIGGQRLSPQGVSATVQWQEALRIKNEIATGADADFYTRLARWTIADRFTRTTSPFSTNHVADYIMNRILQSTIASLREAIQLSPTNWMAFARLAALVADEDPRQNPQHSEEAESYARFALKHDADKGEAWRTLGAIQLRAAHYAEALQSLDKALEVEPGDAQAWGFKGESLEKSNLIAEALAAYDRQLGLLATNAPPAERSRALLHRAHVLRQLGRLEEAADDIGLACGIPVPRDQTDPHLVDLSAFYNAGFKGNWYRDREDNDLSELPTGSEEFDGTSFEVRGLVQIGNETNGFPDSVIGLPVKGKVHRIHFLHSAIRGSDRTGTVVGKYVIHYADGTIDDRPLVLGNDVLDWWTKPPDSGSSQKLQVAWTGYNRNSRGEGKTIQLYKTTWEIPRSDAEIVSMDFVSAKQTTAPFLVAISVE